MFAVFMGVCRPFEECQASLRCCRPSLLRHAMSFPYDRRCRYRCPCHHRRHCNCSSRFRPRHYCPRCCNRIVTVLCRFLSRYLSSSVESGPLRRGERGAAHQGIGRERRPRPRVLPNCSREQGSRGKTCESLCGQAPNLRQA